MSEAGKKLNIKGTRRANVRAALLSVASNSSLVILKIVAGVLTGSVSILAEAIHILIDLGAAVIALFSVWISAKPADEKHPFGHGKVENISGTIEAILIFLAAGLIIYEAIKKIIVGSELALPELGIAIMLFSVVANWLVSKYLLKVSKRTGSLAIEADAGHLTTDVLTSLGVMLGLLVVRLTGMHLLDPLVAIAISFLIIKTAYTLTRKSFGGLVDVRLPATEEQLISNCITEHGRELVGFHKLRTRKSGIHREIDLHLVMSKTVSLEEAHRMCDHLEYDIKKKLPNTTLTIHVEPCETECGECTVVCPLGNKENASRRSGIK